MFQYVNQKEEKILQCKKIHMQNDIVKLWVCTVQTIFNQYIYRGILIFSYTFISMKWSLPFLLCELNCVVSLINVFYNVRKQHIFKELRFDILHSSKL